MLNAAVNFSILDAAFYTLHESKLVASLMATVCTILFSFGLQRSFVFMDKERSGSKLALFVVVAAAGVLVVQNSIFALCARLLQGHESVFLASIHTLAGLHVSPAFVDVNMSNAVASLCALVWNYNGYRLVVFGNEAQSAVEVEDVELA